MEIIPIFALASTSSGTSHRRCCKSNFIIKRFNFSVYVKNKGKIE